MRVNEVHIWTLQYTLSRVLIAHWKLLQIAGTTIYFPVRKAYFQSSFGCCGWITVGKIDHLFFQNFALKKTALVIQILRVCWSIIERQNCYNKPTQSFTYYLFTPSISIKQTKYRLSLLWWISSRRSIDIGMKETRLLFNCMFNREGCEEQCQIKLKLYFLVERTM